MADAFTIRRKLDNDSEELLEDLQARRREAQEEAARKKRLVYLKMDTYFDPLTREILRKVGKRLVFIRHDKRRTPRLTPAQAETGRMVLIQGGLFFDPKAKAVYQFRAGHYVLYSRDRRKATGKSPAGKERRKR
jgi:hypothetical protein